MLKFVAGFVCGAIAASMYKDNSYNEELAESLRRVAAKLESTS